ncbi:hypothetical protein, partial [Proteus vulgaris]|uniref:hypothetical protein n=1 Tax=Proteus vulgaris TaxID=585 RepID=UPI0013D1E4FF
VIRLPSHLLEHAADDCEAGHVCEAQAAVAKVVGGEPDDTEAQAQVGCLPEAQRALGPDPMANAMLLESP